MSLRLFKGSVAVLACLVLAAVVPSVQAQRERVDPSRMKRSGTVRSIFADAMVQVNKSTVAVKWNDAGTARQIALGTIVSEDGFILTKASELKDRSKFWVPLINGNSTRNYDAKVVGISPALDLAMLKIEAKGLTPVVFADTRPGVPDAPVAATDGQGGFLGGPPAGGGGAGRGAPGPGGGNGPRGGRGGRGRGRGITGPVVMPVPTTAPAPPPGAIAVNVGQWVATANAAASLQGEFFQEPSAVGVISTTRRRIPPQNGFLGVTMDYTADNSGTLIIGVQEKSPAERAGIKVNDVVTAVNGVATPDRDTLRGIVQKLGPGEMVTLAVTRGDQTLTLRATLGLMISPSPAEADMQRRLAGDTSVRSGDFPAVFQHDTVIHAMDCGGPIVDLEGHVLGINIARAGRTETYAVPADLILPLIEPMKSGKLAPPGAK